MVAKTTTGQAEKLVYSHVKNARKEEQTAAGGKTRASAVSAGGGVQGYSSALNRQRWVRGLHPQTNRGVKS